MIRVCVNLKPEVLDALKAFSERTGVLQSEVIRRALVRYLDAEAAAPASYTPKVENRSAATSEQRSERLARPVQPQLIRG